jgi:hypothetical protein
MPGYHMRTPTAMLTTHYISYGLSGPEIAASYRSEAIDRAADGTGHLQGRERGLGTPGWMHPCSDEKKIARCWQEVLLPNSRSISHMHINNKPGDQIRQQQASTWYVLHNDWYSCH